MRFRDFRTHPKKAEYSAPRYMVILFKSFFLLDCFYCRTFIYRDVYLESFYELIHVIIGCCLSALVTL